MNNWNWYFFQRAVVDSMALYFFYKWCRFLNNLINQENKIEKEL